MSIFALDTNIISYLLKDDNQVTRRMKEEALLNNIFIIPPIVYYEIRRGLLASQSIKHKRLFDEMCDILTVGKITLEMLDEAAKYTLSLESAVN